MLWRITVLIGTFFSLSAADVSSNIHVDQVGYLPSAPKIAVIAVTSPAFQFAVRRTSDGQAVFNGTLADPRPDSLSGDTVQLADFSQIRAEGEFYVDVIGVGRSYDFGINRNIFSRAFYLTMRGYYGQRCGTKVDLSPDFPTYQHAACHLTGAYDASSGKTGPHGSAGGWHDAGDYGRYVVNSGISTGTLLWAWEIYHARLGSINLNIPESGGTVPDMLSEIRWNLDWMLSMQDQDGGVWHKQTSASFPAFIMPEADKTTSLVIGTGSAPYKSSCATGDFAAVMAIASRAFAPYDSEYSQKTLQASRIAWTWLSANPNVTFSNPPGISTGEYGDSNCSDERLWASAELYRTTSDATYNTYFLANYGGFLSTISAASPPGWPSVGALGLWTYAMAANADRSSDAFTAIQSATLKAADAIATRTVASPYQISMQTNDYYWGSNSVAANYSMQLLIANVLHPDPRYTDAAFENLHYLLGRNAFSFSWVTQLGSNPFRHPHHRPSGADTNTEPWPGLLSGGPNPGRQDSVMQTLANLPPMRMWKDDQGAYSANEIAINWNAPLVFVLAAALPDPLSHGRVPGRRASAIPAAPRTSGRHPISN